MTPELFDLAAIEPVRYGNEAQFIGRARVHSVSEGVGTAETGIRAVYFDPGARSRPHTHSCDQVLLFLEAGIVAVDGGEDVPVGAGQLVRLPAGVAHMHGAGPDAPAVHVSVMRSIDSDFACPIAAAWERFR